MRTTKYIDLTIKDFCGIKSKHIKFFDPYTIISGKNGVGKTTIANALSFLLSKQSIDGKSNFDWMPIIADGEINIGAMCELILNAEINGEPTRFSMIREQKGKSYDFVYKINDKSFKANEYYQNVITLIGLPNKEMFLSCFNIDHLIGMGTKGRNIIMSLFDLDKNEVLETSYKNANGNKVKFTKRYKTLMAKGDDFETMKKDIKKDADKIDDAIKTRLGGLSELQERLKSVNTTEKVIDLKAIDKEIADIKKEKLINGTEWDVYNTQQSQKNGVMVEIRQTESSLAESNRLRSQLVASIKGSMETYKSIKNRTNNECEICQSRLKEIETSTKESIEKNKEVEAKLPLLEKDLVALKNTLNTFTATPPTKYQHMFDQNIMKLEHSKQDDTKLVEDIKNRIVELTNEITQKRKELSVAKAYAIEHQAFVKAYSLRIEELVNEGLDQDFSIKLFTTLKNGSIKSTFEPVIGDIPFNMASTAEKARGKVNLVEILQAKLGVKIPLLVDFHESLDEKIKTNNQVIALEVVRSQELLIGKDI